MEPVDPREQRRRDKRYEKLKNSPSAGAGGALGELLSAFSPAAGHAIDEQRRQANTRYQVETGDDPLGVNLEKGIVKIVHKRKD